MRFANTKAEFDAILAAATDRAVVVDFTASWCGPCQAIAPLFEELAAEFSHCDFIKVDVDNNREVAQLYGISAMPTFKVFRGGAEVGMARGASPDGLRQLVQTHAGPKPKQRVDPAAQQAAQQEALKTLLAGGNANKIRTAIETLLKIYRNVLNEPTEAKFRALKAENKAVKEKVLVCCGGQAMLLATGFERQNVGELARPEMYVLPIDAALEPLEEACKAMEIVLPHLTSS